MTIKYQIKHGAIQKVCHLHNSIFYPYSTLSHFVSYTPSLPLCYSLNFTTKLNNERKEDFLHIWLLHRFTLYQKRKKPHL